MLHIVDGRFLDLRASNVRLARKVVELMEEIFHNGMEPKPDRCSGPAFMQRGRYRRHGKCEVGVKRTVKRGTNY